MCIPMCFVLAYLTIAFIKSVLCTVENVCIENIILSSIVGDDMEYKSSIGVFDNMTVAKLLGLTFLLVTYSNAYEG